MSNAAFAKKLRMEEWEKDLIDFRTSPKDTMKFPSSLTNVERKELHRLCCRYGLVSKSAGKGGSRVLTVTKSKKAQSDDKLAANTFQLSISDTSLSLLQGHLQRCPPTKSEQIRAGVIKAEGEENGSWKLDLQGSKKSREFLRKRRSGDAAALNKTSKEIKSLWEKMVRHRKTSGKAMEQFRAGLPAAKYKDQILEAVSQNQVLLISGETGCGKTTQVPQYLLDDAWAKKKSCRILCTQPRRIAATMVSTRVAEERGEALGKTVGYRVMLDKVCGPDSALIYATTGIMLKDLTNADFRGEWTHLIIDEVHERDHNSDFLLVILRDLLPKHPELKLILMSATLHKELFVEYFGNCPSLHIEGRTYPVQDYYLDDILAGLYNITPTPQRTRQPRVTQEERSHVEGCIEEAFLHSSSASLERLQSLASRRWEVFEHSGTGLTPLSVAVIHGFNRLVSQFLKLGADPNIRSSNGLNCAQWAEKFNRHSIARALEKFRREKEREMAYRPPKNGDLDYPLLVALIQKLCHDRHWRGNEATGSILVFLSGWKEILQMRQQLIAAGFNDSKAVILCLHSTIPPKEQKLAFQPAPVGRVKIVLSTPIAETSITIDDVTIVINCGKMKEKSFDAVAGVATLQNRWISKANQTQRAGRAGRCQAGLAFHVYTRREADELEEFIEPEICRISLEEICLQARVCLEHYEEPLTIQEFLQKAPNPPSTEAVEKAITLLVEIGALTEDQHLTVLGRRLASLPMDPRTGRMILYGILFNCLDPILTITCAISHRSPWVLSVDKKEEIKKIQMSMSEPLGGASDHLATIQAFQTWQSSDSKRLFCDDNFLSHEALCVIDGLRRKIQSELKFRGMPIDNITLKHHSSDAGLVRSLLACGLYPMIGSLKKRAKIKMKDRVVEMLGSSTNSALKVPGVMEGGLPICPLMAFEEITRGDFQVYVRDTTAFQPHPLPLVASQLQIQDCIRPFSGPLRSEEEYQDGIKTLVVDNWLNFVTKQSAAEALAILRIRLQDALIKKVLQPRNALPPVLTDTVETVRKYFSCEAGIPDETDKEETSSTPKIDRSRKKNTPRLRARSSHVLTPMETSEDEDEASSDEMAVDN